MITGKVKKTIYKGMGGWEGFEGGKGKGDILN